VFIAWAVSCESYEINADLTAEISQAGLDTFYVDALPAKVDITLLVRVSLMEEEQGEIDLLVMAAEPPTAQIAYVTVPIDPEFGPNYRPGYLATHVEVLELTALPVETEGIYSVEIYDAKAQAATAPDKRATHFFSVRLHQAE
jgi:hypothetical protein